MAAPLPVTAVGSTIHVVDDDMLFRNAMARILRSSGYQMALYESGDDFLTKLPVSDAGCILLDLQMVGVNGFELQERLTKAGNILPIIFLSAHGDIRAGVHASQREWESDSRSVSRSLSLMAEAFGIGLAPDSIQICQSVSTFWST